MVIDGAKAAAIHSEAPAAATPTSITVKNSTLTSSGDGIVIRGGTTDLTFAKVTLSNASGLAIDVAASAGVPGTLNFTADASQLTGRAVTEAGSVSTVVLGSGTIWNLTGDSNLTNLTNDASSILFSPPTGGAFRTLTTVNYVGVGGTLGLHTFLGTDGSPSDKLAIKGGAATGFTSILITNAGGPGSQTFGNGILVVDAQSTTAPGAFALGKQVVAGRSNISCFAAARTRARRRAGSCARRSTAGCRRRPLRPARRRVRHRDPSRHRGRSRSRISARRPRSMPRCPRSRCFTAGPCWTACISGSANRSTCAAGRT